MNPAQKGSGGGGGSSPANGWGSTAVRVFIPDLLGGAEGNFKAPLV